METSSHVWVCASVLLLLTHLSLATKQDKNLYCSICRAVVDEMVARIGDIDPNHKVKVAGYRMDPDGNRRVVEKPYAKSQEHMNKMFGDVCESMKDYGLRQTDGKLNVVRTRSRSGEEIYYPDVGFTDNIRQTFKAYCEALLDDYEDEIRSLFKMENLQTIESELCGQLTDSCTEEDLNRPFSTQTDRQIHRSNTFHDSEEDEEDIEDEEEDLENNIVEPSASKAKRQQEKKDEL